MYIIYIFIYLYVYIRTHTPTHTYTCKHKHACTSRCASIVKQQYIYSIYNGDSKIAKGAHNASTFSAYSKKTVYTKCIYIHTTLWTDILHPSDFGNSMKQIYNLEITETEKFIRNSR